MPRLPSYENDIIASMDAVLKKIADEGVGNPSIDQFKDAFTQAGYSLVNENPSMAYGVATLLSDDDHMWRFEEWNSALREWGETSGQDIDALPPNLASLPEFMAFVKKKVLAYNRDSDMIKPEWQLSYDEAATGDQGEGLQPGVVSSQASEESYDIEDRYNDALDANIELDPSAITLLQEKEIAEIATGVSPQDLEKYSEAAQDFFKDACKNMGVVSIDLGHLIPSGIDTSGEFEYFEKTDLWFSTIISEVENKLQVLKKYWPDIVSKFSEYTEDRCYTCNDKVSDSFATVNAIIGAVAKAHSDNLKPSSSFMLDQWSNLQKYMADYFYETQQRREKYDEDPGSISWRPVCKARIPRFGMVSQDAAERPFNVSRFDIVVKDEVNKLDLASLTDEQQERARDIYDMDALKSKRFFYAYLKTLGKDINYLPRLSVNERGRAHKDLDLLREFIKLHILSGASLPQADKFPGKRAPGMAPAMPGISDVKETPNITKTSPKNYAEKMEKSYRYYTTRYARADEFEHIFTSPEEVMLQYSAHMNQNPDNPEEGQFQFASRLGYYYSDDHTGCNSGLSEWSDRAEINEATISMKAAMIIYLAAIDPILSLMRVPQKVEGGMDVDWITNLVKDMISRNFGDKYGQLITKEFVTSIVSKDKKSDRYSVAKASPFCLEKIAGEIRRVRQEEVDIVLSGQTTRVSAQEEEYALHALIAATRRRAEATIEEGLQRDGYVNESNQGLEWSIGAVDESLIDPRMGEGSRYDPRDVIGYKTSAYQAAGAMKALESLTLFDLLDKNGKDKLNSVRRLLTYPKTQAAKRVADELRKLQQYDEQLAKLDAEIQQARQDYVTAKETADPTKDNTRKFEVLQNKVYAKVRERRKRGLELAAAGHPQSQKYQEAVKLYEETKEKLKPIKEAIKEVVAFVKKRQDEIIQMSLEQLEGAMNDDNT